MAVSYPLLLFAVAIIFPFFVVLFCVKKKFIVALCLQPERISGEQYGIHADVWSVGISFMEVCKLLMASSVSWYFFALTKVAELYGKG